MSTKQTNKTFVGTSLADLLSIGPKCKQTIVSYSHKGKKKRFHYWYTQEGGWISKTLSWVKEARYTKHVLHYFIYNNFIQK